MILYDTCEACGKEVWFNIINGMKQARIGHAHHRNFIHGIICRFKRAGPVEPKKWNETQRIIWQLERSRKRIMRKMRKG